MRTHRFFRLLGSIALAWGVMGSPPRAARADVALNGVNLIYHGGALMQNVKVAPLLYGSSWQAGTAPSYVNDFLQTLFTDGRFMANLGQYSVNSQQIGHGSALNTVVDPASLAMVSRSLAAPGVRYQVTDAQILAEIKAQIAAGKLPAPNANTLFVVFVPSDVVVVQSNANSEVDFTGYHSDDAGSGILYGVVAPTGTDSSAPLNVPAGYSGTQFERTLTSTFSHELADAVTDPANDGWYDENQLFGGEVADIPVTLRGLNFITDDQIYALLTGADGTTYAVQTVWSAQAKGPAAFATVAAG